jgi:hypothetical protein
VILLERQPTLSELCDHCRPKVKAFLEQLLNGEEVRNPNHD